MSMVHHWQFGQVWELPNHLIREHCQNRVDAKNGTLFPRLVQLAAVIKRSPISFEITHDICRINRFIRASKNNSFYPISFCN